MQSDVHEMNIVWPLLSNRRKSSEITKNENIRKKINKKHNNNTLVSAMTYDKQNHKLYYLQTFVNSISNTHIHIYTIISKGICSSKTKTESFSIHTHTHTYIYKYIYD